MLKAVDELTPEEQDELIRHISTKRAPRQHTPLNFPVDDLGEWSEEISLRREDWYGDDER